MNVDEMLQGAQDALAVSRVYGEPIQKQRGHPHSRGGGHGRWRGRERRGEQWRWRLRGQRPPVGMWVIRGEAVNWEPAVDATKIALRGMLVAIVFLLVVRSVVKTIFHRTGCHRHTPRTLLAGAGD